MEIFLPIIIFVLGLMGIGKFHDSNWNPPCVIFLPIAVFILIGLGVDILWFFYLLQNG